MKQIISSILEYSKELVDQTEGKEDVDLTEVISEYNKP